MILLLDPSFTLTGYAVLDKAKKPIAAGWIETKKAKNKKIRVSEDDMDRARYLGMRLLRVIDKHKIQGLCIEVPTGSQSALASKGLGIAKGCVATVAEARDLPCTYRTPQEIKKIVAGSNNASKLQIEKAVKKFFHVNVKGNAKQREAQYDALAVGIACWDSDLIRILTQR